MSSTSETLREIRNVEVAMAQRVERAREDEAAALAETRAAVDRVIVEARERGRVTAEQRYGESITAAKQAAAEIADRAQAAAAALQTGAAAHVAAAVAAVVELLLSPPREKGK